MKRFISFSSLMAVIGLIMLFLFFTPCYNFVHPILGSGTECHINMFQAAFGTVISWGAREPGFLINTPACAGLVIAFVFLLVGILINVAANKIKILNFLAFGFYLTSSVLIFCGLPLLTSALVDGDIPQIIIRHVFVFRGFATTIGVFICLLSAGSLISGVTSLFKPKPKEVY